MTELFDTLLDAFEEIADLHNNSDFLQKVKDVRKKHEELNESKLKEADKDYLKIGNMIYPGSAKTADMTQAQIKAAYDQEQADKEEAKRTAELAAKAADLRKQIPVMPDATPEERLSAYFKVLVPESGMCDTLAGELVRAVNKIEYRRWNDGDYFFIGYGLETCGPAAAFICDNAPKEISDMVYNLASRCVSSARGGSPEDDFNDIDPVYESGMQEIIEALADYLDNHDELMAIESPCDMQKCNPEGYFDELRYDYSFEIDEEVQKFIDADKISDRDIEYEVENWLSNSGVNDADVSIQWGEVYIENLDPDGYNAVHNILYNGNRWNDPWRYYIDQLYEEYGDPDEEEYEDEEDFEESKKVKENRVNNDLVPKEVGSIIDFFRRIGPCSELMHLNVMGLDILQELTENLRKAINTEITRRNDVYFSEDEEDFEESKKVKESNYDGRDLSKVENSLSYVLTQLSDSGKLQSCKTPQEVKAVVLEAVKPFVGKGISEKTYRELDMKLSRAKNMFEAFSTVYNSNLFGSGLGVVR